MPSACSDPCARFRPDRLPATAGVEQRADSCGAPDLLIAAAVSGGEISRALLGDDSRLRLPRFMEEEVPKDPEATKQDLIDKIAQLNASIDEVAATLKAKDVEVVHAELS
ncbi:hypothetical protein MNEG_7484 [Monoraphidium neglectum]|uniref:Uncharacterized protein n=1 Tax=Monoraphidium neglectum TaxID=145388 RepID=A0A0D2N2R7_9CHLO|nr:hypothetical protein MNEG_7484 [Monoraphidium neglectum]KIZ00476.1 hypothetical protein MNEG_7484 [Monoraphidium neglectum]|eukprot:XP_013899495.1 hypothetical protein MNEG_7484 [Monoraphidium neglectum]